ncbi:shufflon system plasmid conjugative transfer pilus tip adhesin PilV [Enterobacteriaceae bacterium H16N7]|nr:shufflon system plasmid conjugative transfer pilus tip adhesin PilV [Dryocola clanedunensis]
MKTRKIHAGVTLPEITFVLIIILGMLIVWGFYKKQSLNELEYNHTAIHMKAVSSAATAYIHDNYTDLARTVKVGKPGRVTPEALRDAGYLVPGFSLTNNADQTYKILIAVNPKFSTRLVGFVMTENGTEIPFDGLRTIAAKAGGMAGYVHERNIAQGAFGGWEVKLTDYGLSSTPGHLVTFIPSDKLGGGAGAGDRLYRYSVDGHPALNQMKTALDMDANNISNAATVNTKILTASDKVTTNTLTANQSISTRDLSASSRVNTNILTASSAVNTQNLTASNAVSAKSVTASAAMQGGTVRANGRLATGEVLQLDKVNVAGTACSPNGLFSRDTIGSPLFCISGKWSSAGGGFKMPKPQIISCSIEHESGADYSTDTYYAKLDTEGTLWTRLSNGEWVRGGMSVMKAGGDKAYTQIIPSLTGVSVDMDARACGTSYGDSYAECAIRRHTCTANWVY